MDLRVYEVLCQFNQRMDQALESLKIVETLELGSPKGISRVRTNLSELLSYGNNHFASLELKSREVLRREQGLPSRAVILPWTQADANRILAMQNAVPSSLPTQAEQSRIIGDSERENQRGGTPT